MRKVLAIALVFGLGCASGPEAAGPPPAAPPTAVKVLAVEAGSASDAAEAPGVIGAEESAVVRPEIAGLVAAIGFEDGAVVAADQLLVRLRDVDARAAVSEADARLKLAEAALVRTRTLAEHGNSAPAELERAAADRDLAAAQLARAREGLRRTVVRAPFAGVVGRRLVAPGELIDPSREITRIEAIDRVTVDASFPERYLPAFSNGARATATVEVLPGFSREGTVVYVAPRVSDGARTVAVRVRLDNADHVLHPGMTARVSVSLGALADAVSVPTQAVVQGAKGPSVWVVDAEDKAQPRPITVGPREAAEVRVTGGLAPGDRVIIEGMLRLKPGAPVRVLP